MFAIKNTKTNKWVCGTDYRYKRPHQITSILKALLFGSYFDAECALIRRRCSKDYKVVEVELREV